MEVVEVLGDAGRHVEHRKQLAVQRPSKLVTQASHDCPKHQTRTKASNELSNVRERNGGFGQGCLLCPRSRGSRKRR